METDVSRGIEEQLSAFLDGELPEEELQLLVRRLERDEAYRATLVRYSLIGNVLRNDPVGSSSEAFRSGIMAAISSEPEVVEYQSSQSSPGFAWTKPLVSAAMVVVVLAGLFNMDMFEGITQPALPGLAFTEQAENRNLSGVTLPQIERKASINRERMTSYLVSHSEHARSFQGPMADSRIFVQQASFEQ
jgi:negative regulator of sigma E activity